MTNAAELPVHLPVWVDVMVGTAAQRETLMDFYRDALGWGFDIGTEEVGFYSMGTLGGATVFGLGEMEGAGGHLVTYFKTDDIESDTQRAVSLGATLAMGPHHIEGTGFFALLMDPVGAMHGLWQQDGFEGFGELYVPGAPGWFDHASQDPATAARYYQELLGVDHLEPEPGMSVLAVGEQWFASISPNPVAQRPTQWNPVYIAETLERVHEAATRHGGEVVVAEMPVPGSAVTVVRSPATGEYLTFMRAGEPG